MRGPPRISDHPEFFLGLIVCVLFCNLFLLVRNIPLVGTWARLRLAPHHVLCPTVVVPSCVGVHSIDNSIFDIWATEVSRNATRLGTPT